MTDAPPDSAALFEVPLTTRAARLAAKGRPWFYRDDCGKLPDRAGLVRVVDGDGRDLGLGLCSLASKLCIRLCGSWPREESPSLRAFLEARLGSAIERRAALFAAGGGVRLVHGESDGLPGLVVDRFDHTLVLQVTSSVLESALADLVAVLVDRLDPVSVLVRDDVSARKLEGLPEGPPRLVHGKRVDHITIDEGGVAHTARPWDGHKTGFYLDQRPARAAVRGLAKGRRVLDLFAYQGSFSLHALRGGARSALAIDESQQALEQARSDAERNELRLGEGGLETEAANAFQRLRSLRQEGREFDLIVVDPPAFAKARKHLRKALEGYRDLNRSAIRLLAPGGVLVTCSCSHHVDGFELEQIVRQAGAGVPFRLALRQRLGAGEDHPVWTALPESEYLKVRVYERFDL